MGTSASTAGERDPDSVIEEGKGLRMRAKVLTMVALTTARKRAEERQRDKEAATAKVDTSIAPVQCFIAFIPGDPTTFLQNVHQTLSGDWQSVQHIHVS